MLLTIYTHRLPAGAFIHSWKNTHAQHRVTELLHTSTYAYKYTMGSRHGGTDRSRGWKNKNSRAGRNSRSSNQCSKCSSVNLFSFKQILKFEDFLYFGALYGWTDQTIPFTNKFCWVLFFLQIIVSYNPLIQNTHTKNSKLKTMSARPLNSFNRLHEKHWLHPRMHNKLPFNLTLQHPLLHHFNDSLTT